MRVLVTGASSPMGLALRDRIERRRDLTPIYFVGFSTASRSSGQAVDVSDPRAFENAILAARPDVLIHLAGISGPLCDLDPSRTTAVNVSSVETIARAAKRAAISRVILASSSAVYGDRHRQPISEGIQVNPHSTYARSKLRAEDTLRQAASENSATKFIALRIFNVFGEDFPNSLVHRLRTSSHRHPVTLNGLDCFVRDYIHVNDVSKSIVSALDARLAADFTPINVGSGIATSNRDLVDKLLSQGSIAYKVGPDVPSYSCADITLARNTLGLDPSIAI